MSESNKDVKDDLKASITELTLQSKLSVRERARPYKSNRLKAIIAINIYAVVAVGFVYSNKVAVNDLKTPIYDLTFLINVFGSMLALTLACCTKKLSDFKIPKKDYRIFFSRCLMGGILIAVAVIGNTLLPVTVQ